LSWNASSGATSYQVYRNGTLVYNGSALFFSDTGLTAGSSYVYTITATGPGGVSSAGGTTPAKTTAPAVCAPTATFTANGSQSISVIPGQTINYAWSSTNANSYTATYTNTCGIGGTWGAANGSAGGTNSATVSSSQAGCTYVITYNATNSATGINASATVTVSVGTIACSLSVNHASVYSNNSDTWVYTGTSNPSGYAIKRYGTKNGVMDLNGDSVWGPTNFNLTYGPVGPGTEGTYVRWFTISDPNTGALLCTSNQATMTILPVVSACSGGIDIGLRLYQNGVRKIAVQPGAPTSPLRVYKNGVYGVVLVDPSDPNASKMLIQTSSGVKAYCLLP
jgi:hypothetical protein